MLNGKPVVLSAGGESGVAWAVERHWRFYAGVCRSLTTAGVTPPRELCVTYVALADTLRQATPVYVAPHVYDDIHIAAQSLPPSFRVCARDLLLTEGPLSVWLDIQARRRAQVVDQETTHQGGVGYVLGFIITPAVFPDEAAEGLIVTVVLEAHTTWIEDSPDRNWIGWGRLPAFQLAWRDGDRAIEFRQKDLPFAPDRALHFSDVNASVIQYAAQFVLAALVWMRDRLTRVDITRAPRHARKRLGPGCPADCPHDPFRVIALRRLESPAPAMRPGAPVALEWSCRWVVRGHWRRLPTERTTWVHTHLKGPVDKPLRAPSQMVFAATR